MIQNESFYDCSDIPAHDRCLSMMKKVIGLVATTFVLVSPALAQDSDIPGSKANMPTLANYPDMGQEFGMQWIGWGEASSPRIDFAAPETDNRLWTIRCERRGSGKVRIVHQIEGSLKDMGANDRFGFTIRVDDRPSLGLIARMELTDGEGGKYYVPRFYTANRHPLYEALAKGSRAYINLNGNKFSVHLKGSGNTIKQFLRACQ